MDFLNVPACLADVLPPGQEQVQGFLDKGGWVVVGGIGAVIVVLILASILSRALRGRRRAPSREQGLQENLAEYPPPPGKPGPRRLLVEGVPARIRLVVVAPVGKQAQLDAGKAEPLLEHVLRGLGEVARHDKPRVRIWPPQLSHQGFAVTFQRLTEKPDPDGRPSRWVLLAGQARVGTNFILLGLALLADEKTSVGRRTLDPEEWAEVLRIKAPGG
jgi:hypothetical protein